MIVRVLGCSGGICQNRLTTSFLIGQHILVDAGTGLNSLTVQEMMAIDHVFLTHSHLDHVACLPLMVDTVASQRRGIPITVHALPETIQALREHIFNDMIWPDFTALPNAHQPFVRFQPMQTGDRVQVAGHWLEALPATHSVPAVGYAVSQAFDSDGLAEEKQNAARARDKAPTWVFSGDTGPNPAFWARINSMNVAALVIETAFSDDESIIAQLSGHLSPAALVMELDAIAPSKRYPIYISHTKPAETETIMQQVAQHSRLQPNSKAQLHPHDIRWLNAGAVIRF